MLPWHKLPHPMIPLSPLTEDHSFFSKRELSLLSSMGDVWQSAAPPGPTTFKCSTQSFISQSFHWVYSVVSYLPPPTMIMKIYFYSENLHFFMEIICLHLTVVGPDIIKREILHQAQKVLFKAQSFNLQHVVCHVIANWIMFGKPRSYFVMCMYN